MDVTFLGTGTSQGIPVIACSCEVCRSVDEKDKRLRSSVLIEKDGKTIVIDTGPDFRQQMLRAGVERLDAVVFTHEHKDHIAGLDDVRAFNFKANRDMPIYGTADVEAALKREFHYAFGEASYPGVPRLDFRRITNNPFDAEGLDLIPIKVWHYKMPVFGFRIDDFVYVTDAKTIDPEEKEKMKGAKVLVLNALRKQAHLSHLNLKEALNLVEELNPEQVYLTHISHLLGSHSEVEKELPSGVNLAYDGLKISLT